MEKLNVAERRTYVAPELSIAEFAIENGFGNSVLALFKESAVRIMNQEAGALVPFNMFYDALDLFSECHHINIFILLLIMESIDKVMALICRKPVHYLLYFIPGFLIMTI